MDFRNDINGLRAIAVTLVILFHFSIPGFQGGFIGVDVFFVLSGYLMTGIIFSKLDANSFFIFDFYLDRMKRILPALTVLCACLLAIGWFILLPINYSLLGKHAAVSISFLSNIAYWKESGYFDAASHDKWLLHTWSLSVEWQFYILYPITLVALKHFFNQKNLKYFLIAGIVISYSLSVLMTENHQTPAFFLLPTRAWEMLAGGMLFLCPIKLSSNQSKISEYSGLTIIMASASLLSADDLWPGYLVIFPVLGTALVLASNNQNSIFTNTKPSQWLGRTSYSTYLWHWPVVVFLSYFNLQSDYIYITAGVLTSILLGHLSYEVVEKNSHYLKYPSGTKSIKELFSNKVFILSTCFVICIGLIGTYVKLNNGIPNRMPASINQVLEGATDRNPRSSDCNVNPSSPLESPKCIYGNAENISAIVLGDSHSNAVVTAIEESMKKFSGGALFLGADGCFSLINTRNWYFNDCNKYNEWVRKEITNDKTLQHLPIIIINRTSGALKGSQNKRKFSYVNNVKRGDNGFIESFTSEYKNTICQLSKSNPIYIVQPIAEMPFNVPTFMAKAKLFGFENKFNLSIPAYNERHADALKMMAHIENECGIALLDPIPYLCKPDFCPPTIDGRSLYYDDDHLNEYGNKFLVPMFNEIWK